MIYVFILLIIALILLIILAWTMKKYTFSCSNCGANFQVPIKDLPRSSNNNLKGYTLQCPNCKKTSTMKVLK